MIGFGRTEDPSFKSGSQGHVAHVNTKHGQSACTMYDKLEFSTMFTTRDGLQLLKHFVTGMTIIGKTYYV